MVHVLLVLVLQVRVLLVPVLLVRVLLVRVLLVQSSQSVREIQYAVINIINFQLVFVYPADS